MLCNHVSKFRLEVDRDQHMEADTGDTRALCWPCSDQSQRFITDGAANGIGASQPASGDGRRCDAWQWCDTARQLVVSSLMNCSEQILVCFDGSSLSTCALSWRKRRSGRRKGRDSAVGARDGSPARKKSEDRALSGAHVRKDLTWYQPSTGTSLRSPHGIN